MKTCAMQKHKLPVNVRGWNTSLLKLPIENGETAVDVPINAWALINEHNMSLDFTSFVLLFSRLSEMEEDIIIRIVDK